MILALSIAGIVIGLVPAAMFLKNLPLFLFTVEDEPVLIGDSDSIASVSVLIPARDEEAAVGRSIEAALQSEGMRVEVIVLDDDSSDATAEIVKQCATSDGRVRYLRGEKLPALWNGKQFACLQLAEAASHERIVFLDADVRLRPAALKRLSDRYDQTGVALLSAFPHQETLSVLEKWMIPLMHFILLGFLPLERMRASTNEAYGAGCGQLFMTTRDAYRSAGTHGAIRASRHDGLKLPRAYRGVGLMTDVVDGTALAECRMYENSGQVIRGLLKNAVEGIANPKLIVLFSILLIGGSVLPMVTLGWAISEHRPLEIVLSTIGVLVGHLPRAIAAIRFRQPFSGVLFHSFAIVSLSRYNGLPWSII